MSKNKVVKNNNWYKRINKLCDNCFKNYVKNSYFAQVLKIKNSDSYLYSINGLNAFYKQFTETINNIYNMNKEDKENLNVLNDKLTTILLDINDRFYKIEQKLNIK